MIKNQIFIITGAPGAGKTTFIKNLAVLLKDAGYRCGGFYAEGYWGEKLRSGFDLVEINGKAREALCNTTKEPGDEPYRHFFFKKEGLNLGSKILKNAEGEKIIVFIDEIGGFELNGQGWAGAVEKLLQNPPRLMIWTVRENLLDEVCRYFSILPQAVWHIDNTEAEAVAAEIKTLLLKN
jgi:nucleoside-triphosphatase THEP1